MTTFTAWKFETDDGAAKAVVALEAAQTDGLVTLVDHAVISWPQGEQRPELHHARDDTKRGTAWGAFWGLLFGGLFFARCSASRSAREWVPSRSRSRGSASLRRTWRASARSSPRGRRCCAP